MNASALQTIAVTHVDNAGISRLKLVPAARLPSVVKSGATVSLNVAMLLAVDDHPVSTPALETVIGDLRLFPDVAGLAVVDAERGLGWVPADLRDLHGDEYAGCARTLLRRVVREASDAGIEFSFGVELEFTLLRREPDVVPAHSGPGYGVRPFLELEDFHLDLMRDLLAAGVHVEQLHPEYGAGQVELSFSPADPQSAIDEVLLARFVVVRTARAHGFDASFAPISLPGSVGNGLHMHFSARQEDRNVFADPTRPFGVSATGEQMIAGVLAGLRSGIALLTGSTVSFQRLRPKNWAGGYLCWGDGNREAALRLMRGFRGAEDRQANVEVKVVDGSSNPYLAAAWILASAMNGVRAKARPPAPVAVDPSSLTDAARAAAGIEAFPANLGEALDRLDEDGVARGVLGDILLDAFIAVRRHDAEAFAAAEPAEAVIAQRWRS